MDLEHEFIFEKFHEAMEIHTRLFKLLRKNGFVTYADLCYMLREDRSIDFPERYFNIGWDNLFYSKVEPTDEYVNGKWLLILPKPKTLNFKKIFVKG